MNSNDILTDISFLYELSLSVGQSLNGKENCKRFLQTLMSRKNLEFGGVWIRNYNIPYSETTSGYKAIYSYPQIKLEFDQVEDSNFLDNCFNDVNAFSTHLTKDISKVLGLKVIDRGVVTFFKLQELGFMVLYSSSSSRVWNQIELRKLDNVIEKFSVSIKACLFHEKSIQDLITISKTQKELEQAKVRAEESNELKSAFLSNISHEIRTPINSILGFSNALSDTNNRIDQQQEFISYISDNSKKLLKLINNLIDISKIDSNQLSIDTDYFNIDHVLKDLQTRYLNQSKALNLDFTTNTIDDGEFIKTDKNKFIKIYENLIENSLKFTEHGRIEIGYFKNKNDDCIFYIRDTGVGIPNEKQESIFDIFRQAETWNSRKYEGSGLGLSLSKRLIDLLNGELWFESKENSGTNFYFRLDGSGKDSLAFLNDEIQDPNNEKHNVITSCDDTVGYAQKNVLIAEDVKSNFNYLNAIIEFTDAKVIWAKTGQEAIDICIRNNPKIDLVLMDIRMPEINGLDATKKIKEFNTNIPVIVQTAFAMNSERRDSIDAGADDFITKPIDPQTLMKILQDYL
jgi:signal transduction histidine kinase/CheY-like chemotaxis protein